MTSKKYFLDRTYCKASTLEEADDNYSYWKNKTLLQRLEAAHYLITSAYNFSYENQPSLDRNYFATRKFNP